MVKNLFAMVALLWLLVAAPKAEAQVYKEFLLCENCTTAGQFESVARNRVTQRGEWNYAVGNPNSGTFRYVTVTYTPEGEDPWLTSGGASSSKRGVTSTTFADGIVVVENEIPSPIVYAPANPPRGTVKSVSGGTSTATSQPASAAANQQFQAIVHISRTRIIVNSPSGNNAFGSLSGAQLEQVSPYLWTAMTVNNPGWNSAVITDALKSLLFKAVGWTQGKGPIACIVFNNGDYGCFQLNPVDRNAAMYVKGTGKNIFGNPIERTPNLPNGGGVETVVRNNDPVGVTRFGLGGSSGWLICASVGGVPAGCYTEAE
jgi:hypothetical protein